MSTKDIFLLLQSFFEIELNLILIELYLQTMMLLQAGRVGQPAVRNQRLRGVAGGPATAPGAGLHPHGAGGRRHHEGAARWQPQRCLRWYVVFFTFSIASLSLSLFYFKKLRF